MLRKMIKDFHFQLYVYISTLIIFINVISLGDSDDQPYWGILN